uniref:Uncharacterized protein n=1 Tax=Strigamia maritima TaxID=126957 RepID=T1JKY0_STRMM
MLTRPMRPSRIKTRSGSTMARNVKKEENTLISAFREQIAVCDTSWFFFSMLEENLDMRKTDFSSEILAYPTHRLEGLHSHLTGDSLAKE